MARTFFLESAQPKKVAVASTKQSFKTVMEQTAILENAILESEVSYKDILIESMQGEASGLLMEADDAKRGEKIKNTLANFFAKMVQFFKNLGEKVANFVRNSLAKIKRFFLNSASWLASKKATKSSLRGGKVKINSRFKELPDVTQFASKFESEVATLGKAKQASVVTSTAAKVSSLIPELSEKASETQLSYATALKNISEGTKVYGKIEKMFKNAIVVSKQGLNDAKAGLSEAKAGKDSAKIAEKREIVTFRQAQARSLSMLSNKFTSVSVNIVKESLKVVRAGIKGQSAEDKEAKKNSGKPKTQAEVKAGLMNSQRNRHNTSSKTVSGVRRARNK